MAGSIRHNSRLAAVGACAYQLGATRRAMETASGWEKFVLGRKAKRLDSALYDLLKNDSMGDLRAMDRKAYRDGLEGRPNEYIETFSMYYGDPKSHSR